MQTVERRLTEMFDSTLSKEFLQSGEIVDLAEGDHLMEYGQKVSFLPLVISGSIRVMRRDEQSREILLYYLSAYESCAMAYACCMEARKSEIRATAEEPAKVLKLPHSKLDQWLVEYPAWKSYVFYSFSLRFNELLKSLESVAFRKLDERLVNYLQQKAQLVGKSTLQISHNQIAEDLGTSRVVISRLLKQLENDRKLLLYRSEIKLLSSFDS